MTRLLAATAILIATQAQAQPLCLPHAMMVDTLKDKYGEQPRVTAVSHRSITEIYANPKTGTWTLLITGTNSMSCIRASGKQGVHVIAPVEPKEPT